MKHAVSESTKRNAQRFIDGSGVEPGMNKTKAMAQFEAFAEIVKIDKFPLPFSDERRISNICKTSSSYVTSLAIALISAGWKPSSISKPTKITLKPIDLPINH